MLFNNSTEKFWHLYVKHGRKVLHFKMKLFMQMGVLFKVESFFFFNKLTYYIYPKVAHSTLINFQK